MKFKLIPKNKKEQELNSEQNSKQKRISSNGDGKTDVGKKRPKWNEGQKSLARKIARARGSDGELAKVLKRAPALLAELITNEDRGENINVIRKAKHAIQRHYDPLGKEWFESPDHKTRLAAATLQLAYDEGTPVQRQVILTASFDSADKTIAKIKESPELLKAIQALQGVGLTLENGAGEAIDIEAEEIFGNQMDARKTETEQSP